MSCCRIVLRNRAAAPDHLRLASANPDPRHEFWSLCMRIARPALLLIAVAALASACAKTGDIPGGAHDTAAPYGGAGANGSVGSTPGYLNAAGADKNPNAGKPEAAPAAAAAATPTDSAAKAPADTTAKH